MANLSDAQLKANNNTNIRTKTTSDKVTRDNVAGAIDDVIDSKPNITVNANTGLRLTAPDSTNTVSIEAIPTPTPSSHQLAYWGTVTNENDIATVTLPGTNQQADVQNSSYSFNTSSIAVPNNHFWYLLIPQASEPTSIIDVAEAIETFNKRQNIRRISNEAYTRYSIQNTSGITLNLHYRVSRS